MKLAILVSRKVRMNIWLPSCEWENGILSHNPDSNDVDVFGVGETKMTNMFVIINIEQLFFTQNVYSSLL